VKRGKCRGGFGLIEALVTTVVLGIGIVGVAGTFTCASLSATKASYMAQARDIAEESLEKMRAEGYAAFTTPSGTVSEPVAGLPHAVRSVAWEPYPNSADEQGLKRVTLDISWRWAGPTGGHYRLVTLVSKPA
jgi:type II secretory pathway pseudopilin PulG